MTMAAHVSARGIAGDYVQLHAGTSCSPKLDSARLGLPKVALRQQSQSSFNHTRSARSDRRGLPPSATKTDHSRIVQLCSQDLSKRPAVKDSNGQFRRGSFRVCSSAQKDAPPTTEHLIISFGEVLIDFVPTVSGVSLKEAPAFKKAAGGAPANVAVGISRLGGNAAFVGKTGEDEFGHMLADLLKENGVNTDGIIFDQGARTALAFVTLRADGEREFMFYRNPSADMLLTPEELDQDLLKQASVFHYGSISLISEPCKSAHLAAMKTAKESGAWLSYDPNLRKPLWPSEDAAREGIFSIWDEADMIKISEEELTFLTEGGDGYSDEVARSLFRGNVKLLLVTEGIGGSRYYTRDAQGRVPGLKVNAVDTTGAGDAFVAGFLTKLAADPELYKDEKKLRETLLFANACGAITTTERGAIPALPTEAAALKLMASDVVNV